MSNPNPTAAPSVTLQTIDGKKVQLRALDVERMFTEAASSLQQHSKLLPTKKGTTNESTMVNASLSPDGLQNSQDGLKSSQDVIKFLNSGAGKRIIALIGRQLAEIASIREHVRQDEREHQREKSRALTFLLLGLMYKDEARANQVKEETLKIIDKQVKQAEQAEQAPQQRQAAAERPGAKVDSPFGSLAACTEKLKSLQGLLDSKLEELIKSEAEIAAIDKEMELDDKKYKLYEDNAVEIFKGPDDPVDIQQKRDDLSKKMDSFSDEIAQHFDKGEVDQAHEKLQRHEAHSLVHRGLGDRLSVLNGTSHMFTSNGARTHNFNEHAFILPLELLAEKKLVYENDKFYLLPKNAPDFDKLSPEEKEAGEKAYHRERPNIMGVVQLIEHNKKLGLKQHTESKSNALEHNETAQQDVAFIANQMTQVQAAIANQAAVANLTTNVKMEAAPSTTPSVAPSPTPGPHSASTAAHTSSVSQVYSHVLQLMRNATTPQAMDRAMDLLKKSMPDNEQGKQIQSLLGKIGQLLQPGQPIPAQLMDMLLSKPGHGNASLGVNTPEAIKSKPSQLSKAAPSTAPTPFATTPFNRPK